MRDGRVWERDKSLEWKDEEAELFRLCKTWLIRVEDVGAESSGSDWDGGAVGLGRERGTEFRE